MTSYFWVLLSKVTLDVQDGSEEVRSSLVGGQTSVITSMTSLESGNCQKTGKVIYDRYGHFWRMSIIISILISILIIVVVMLL